MQGNLVIMGMQGNPTAVTLRLMSRDQNTDWFLKQSEHVNSENKDLVLKAEKKIKHQTSSDEEFSSEVSDDDGLE